MRVIDRVMLFLFAIVAISLFVNWKRFKEETATPTVSPGVVSLSIAPSCAEQLKECRQSLQDILRCENGGC